MRHRKLGLSVAWLFASTLASMSSTSAQCLSWSRDFAPDGVNGTVLAMAVFDDGSGPALYAAGYFERAGAINTNNIARWNGSGWLALTSGNNGSSISTLQVFDDGSGPALYAGGFFNSIGGVSANNIARWDGSEWTALGSGTSGEVSAMTIFDDGSGPALHVGGDFITAGGLTVNNIAKWDGSSWSALSIGVNPGPNNRVNSLAVYTNNGHTALYAGGVFTNAGLVSARCLARWNGLVWSDVDGGVEGFDPDVRSLSVFDDGSGPALVVAGTFHTAGSLAVNNIATWRASTWSALGAGLGIGTQHIINATQPFDDGSGAKLYAVGNFPNSGTNTLNHCARWNGSQWEALGEGLLGTPEQSGISTVYALCPFDDGSGNALYAGGLFGYSGPLNANSIASWKDGSWRPLGTHHGLKLRVTALGVHDDGAGPALFAGGNFGTAGGTLMNHVARWDGVSWQALGEGVSGGVPSQSPVGAFATFDDGNGPALYVAGAFFNAGGQSAFCVARWDGATWSPLGSGLNATSQFWANALVAFDDGSGPALYVGGRFDSAGGVPAANIARWDGAQWTAVGIGTPGTVTALAIFDDGSGPALYAGGHHQLVGGGGFTGVVKWNGAHWSQLPSAGTNSATTLVVHDDGTGPALFVGGANSGVQTNTVSKWDGTSWTTSIGGGTNNVVRALASFDDGSGPALYAAGDFTVAGSTSANFIARWDGSNWAALGTGLTGGGFANGAYALCAYDPAASGAPSLFACGQFALANGKPSLNVAEWFGCGSPGESFCFGDGSGAACPCGNSGEAGHGCDNSQATGGALLESSGWTSLAFDSLHLTASGTLPNAASIFLQGNQQVAPVFFGDGLRCAGGSLTRLFVKAASGGVVSAPGAGDPSISERSSIQGDGYTVGTTRIYQVYYRDADPSFCAAPPGNAWNVSNALRIGWLP